MTSCRPHRSRGRLRRGVAGRDRPELDVAERDGAVVALEGDVTRVGLGEGRHAAELALGDAGLEVVAIPDEVVVLDAVDGDLGLRRRWRHHDGEVAPLA